MHRKPWFWPSFVGVALLASVVAWLGFPKAFPLVTLDASMDRAAALGEAESLAARLGIGPQSPRTALRFGLDARAQTFVELEGGGAERVRALVASEEPSLYRWQVRLFLPNERHEARIDFTPSGTPWGFRETLAEDAPGAALEVEEARERVIAALAASPYDIELADWEDVERSREVKGSGRVDHSFTWRHRELRFGEGEYRLELTLSGDRWTGLRRWIEVPEAFDRRYAEMRSRNELLAMLGTAGLGSFFFAGVGAALLALLRKRWLLWRPAFAWGFLIGGLQALAVLNAWPRAWFGYDTAFSPGLFSALQVLLALGVFLGSGLLLALTFVAAEALSRRAFPEHLRLWSLWSKDVASSKSVFGMTVAGYLLVGVFFAYEVALYFASSRWLGWWSPIGAMQDPDALATRFPWLDAIANSAQAGFWEEALCRAIPLALAAHVGRRFGRERAFVIAMLLLQAVIFGAGHAAYPAQPSYARLLELTIPAIGFGLVYLRFGLLTVVVCHYVYDVVWMALPVLGSSAEGAWVQKGFVGLFALLPLIVVVVARLRAGAWTELTEEHRNASWRPPDREEKEEAEPDAPPRPLSLGQVWGIGALGSTGLLLFALWGSFHTDAPALVVPRAEALERARGELLSRGLELGPEWREIAWVNAAPVEEDELAWRELGPDAYRDFLRDWSGEPEWVVRRLRSEGDVAARAEEWRVAVTASGHARVRHVLPEDAPGPRLGEDTARALALAELERRLGLERGQLEEVEATPSRLPERTDWRFSFRVPEAWPADTGEARAFVDIAGAEVVRSGRGVHVPEAWSRQERERQVRLALPTVVGVVVLALVFGAACLGSLVAWSAGRFCARSAAAFGVLLAVTGLAEAWNLWPTTLAAFDTTRAWGMQVGLALAGLVSAALATATAGALLVGFAAGWKRPASGRHWRRHALVGGALGALASGLITAAGSFGEALAPTWGDYTAVGMRWPLLAEILAGLPALLLGGATLIVVVTAIDRFTRGLTRRKVLGAVTLVLLGLCVGLALGAETMGGLVLGGLAGALLVPAAFLVLRRAPEATPLMLATWLATGRVRTALENVHPDQFVGAAASAVLLLAIAFGWTRRLSR